MRSPGEVASAGRTVGWARIALRAWVVRNGLEVEKRGFSTDSNGP